MQNERKNFFVLLTQIMKLEEACQRLQIEDTMLKCLCYEFNENNSTKITAIKYACKIANKKINELLTQILNLKLDSVMKNYYDLYKEKKLVLKRLWDCKFEIKYIEFKMLFENIFDEFDKNALTTKNIQLKENLQKINEHINMIVLKMRVIYPI